MVSVHFVKRFRELFKCSKGFTSNKKMFKNTAI